MLIAIAVLLGMVALTGLLFAIEAFMRRNTKAIAQTVFAEKKRRDFVRAGMSFGFSSACLLFLLTDYASPIEALIAASMLLGLGYAVAAVNLHDLFGSRTK